MKIDDFSIAIDSGILIVTSKKNVTADNLKEMKDIVEQSMGRRYSCGIYRDALGYYDGYDFQNDISVYCGTLNEKAAIEKIKNYKLIKNLA